MIINHNRNPFPTLSYRLKLRPDNRKGITEKRRLQYKYPSPTYFPSPLPSVPGGQKK